MSNEEYVLESVLLSPLAFPYNIKTQQCARFWRNQQVSRQPRASKTRHKFQLGRLKNEEEKKVTTKTKEIMERK